MDTKNGKILAVINDPFLRQFMEEGLQTLPESQTVLYEESTALWDDLRDLVGRFEGKIVLIFDYIPSVEEAALYRDLKRNVAVIPAIIITNDPTGAQDWVSTRNDIFTVPFRMGTFLDRVAKYLREVPLTTGHDINMGGYCLSPKDNTLIRPFDGETVHLTEKERDTLLRLYRQKGTAVDRQLLLEDVWGYGADLETHTLETHIYRLRQKIEKDPSCPVFLLTDGTGYRLSV